MPPTKDSGMVEENDFSIGADLQEGPSEKDEKEQVKVDLQKAKEQNDKQQKENIE